MDILNHIYQIFALDLFEQYCVSLSLAWELGQREMPRIGDALAGFGRELDGAYVYEVLDGDSTLMRFFFSETADEGPWTERPLRLNRRMLDFCMGDLTKSHEQLGLWMRLRLPEEGEKGDTDGALMKGLQGLVLSAEDGGGKYPPEAGRLIQLYGPEGSGKKHHICRLYDRLGKPLIIADGAMFEGQGRQLLRLTDELLRECLFYGGGLMLINGDRIQRPGEVLNRLFEKLPCIFTVLPSDLIPDGRWDAPLDSGRGMKEKVTWERYGIAVDYPSAERAKTLWHYFAGKDNLTDASILDELPEKFVLTPGKISRVLALARSKAHMRAVGGSAADDISPADIYEACHRVLSANMGKKLQHIQPAYDWEELVLPPVQMEMLKTAVRQVRYRSRVYRQWGFEGKIAYGRGVSMIFSGLPGTGKTMAAQVMASALGMELYRVDLAAVVSKYIGETEKNLEEIFDAAGRAQVILFFDEADVLFAKRTEVKDANDKYSNMEAAYMLQRIESYDGMVILATNYLQNFDEAFKRRMKMIIDFPFPDSENRRRIWQQAFPEETPLDEDVDLDYLARQFEFSGSNIKNAALYGAFLAAAEDRPVNMRDLMAGIRNESAKTGKLLREQDMGEYYFMFRGDGEAWK